MAERIVASGLAQLGKGGIDAITMHGLAADLGYAVGALYRYFRGKDELLLAMQRYVLDGIRDDLAIVKSAAMSRRLSSARMGEPDLLGVLGALYAYASLATRRPEQFALLSLSLGDPRPLLDDERVRQRTLPALAPLLANLGELIDAAASAGALAPGDGAERALVSWSALHGVLATRKLARFDLPKLAPDSLVDELLVTLLTGWGADRQRTTVLARTARKLVADSLVVRGEA